MAALIKLLVTFLCLGAATSEVGDNFNNCKSFFYQETPPVISNTELQEESICQVYNNTYHFATLYSKRFRIPVYSAYDLRKGSCLGTQPMRKTKWFIEPQLLNRQEPRNMMRPSGSRENEYKLNQAINDDYCYTGFDRGHLNPNFYHCGASRTATFTLTNAVPQNACFNQLIWHKLEDKSKNIMDELCSFGGAKRFFVTGTIPYRRLIPNSEHDQGDVRPERSYTRVSVPSHMWTAVCCDSSEATDPHDRNKGFSFGYMGENKADSAVKASSVRQLENSISSIPPQGRSVTIFTGNDKCNENSENSKKALEKVQVVLIKDAVNSLDKLSMTNPSELPFKKRKFDQISQIQSVNALGKKVLFDLTLGVELRNNSNEINSFRESLKSSSNLTMIMTGFNYVIKSQINHNSHDELRKRSSGQYFNENEKALIPTKNKPKIERGYRANDDPEINVDSFLLVAKLSAANITINGDYCRPGHSCDYHDYKYKWCYIDKANNWDYCCLYDCNSADSKSIPKCDVGKDYKGYECSMRSSVITVNADRCRPDHECGLHQKSYYWCYTDCNNNWDYCCQPWHRCDYYRKEGKEGKTDKWCYTGKKMKSWDRECKF